MRLHLEVANGPYEGKICSLAQGDVCSVGSGWNTNLCLQNDPYLLDDHFSIACSRTKSTLFARDPSSPPLVNAESHQTKDLSHLDWIVAGSTLFRVFQSGTGENHTPETASDHLIKEFSNGGAPLYAIVESSRQAQLISWTTRNGLIGYPLTLTEEEQIQSYGSVPTPLKQPWIIALDAKSPAIGDFVRQTWARNSTVYLRSNASDSDLRAHFARYLYSRFEGSQMELPFWVPGIMRSALTAENPKFARQFLALLEEVLVEGESPGMLMRISTTGCTQVNLSTTPKESPLPQQDHLFEQFPQSTADPTTLRQQLASSFPDTCASTNLLIDKAIAGALKRGIKSAAAIAQYVLLCGAKGLEFCEIPEVDRFLGSSSLTKDSALDLFTLAFNQSRFGTA